MHVCAALWESRNIRVCFLRVEKHFLKLSTNDKFDLRNERTVSPMMVAQHRLIAGRVKIVKRVFRISARKTLLPEGHRCHFETLNGKALVSRGVF